MLNPTTPTQEDLPVYLEFPFHRIGEQELSL
jgi:hypothetical protein